MSVTIDQVEKIASLAKLSFSSEEKEKFVTQFNQILEYIDKLNELDTKDIEPTYHVLELENVFRADEVVGNFDQERVLQNAPKKNNGYFSVPKVIG